MRDIDIRTELKRKEFRTHRFDPGTRVLDEMGICQGEVKIDIAVINGSLQGYEIKSARDTLKRLPKQIQYYNKVFDYITIVTEKSHLEKINHMIPSWWGILITLETEEGKIFLDELREPKANIDKDKYALVQLLWKDECLEILKDSYESKGLKNKARKFIWHKLSELYSVEELSDLVRVTLKKRINWKDD